MKYLKALFILSLVSFIGCRAASPKRSSPQEVLGSAEIAADRTQTSTTPKLDIIFVVDNSLSMDVHQIRFGQNVNQFVQAFNRNGLLDVHMGVIAIWDSDPVHSILVAAKHPLGQLIPLQDPDGARGTPLKTGERFATRDTPRLNEVLAKTIFLGTDKGPEYEELFSPVEAFFTPANLNGPNKGFYRPDAHLLVVFITDANDGSMVLSDQFFDDMLALKNGQREKLHFYAIISPVEDPSCHKDLAGPPVKFNTLISYSEGNILSLCSPTFGRELARFSESITEKAGRQVIDLNEIPDFTTLNVTYGHQIIPPATGPNYDNGWSFDARSQQLVIGGKLNLKSEPGAKIKIGFTPVPLENLANGKAHALTPGEEDISQKPPAGAP